MNRLRPRRARWQALGIVLTGLLAGAVIGRVATASTSVPNETLGYGTAASVAAYAISGVSYTLDANSPQNIDQVAFTISPTTARVVQAQLATGGSWYSCTNTSGSVTCATTSPTQATVNASGSTLTVEATQ